MAQRSEIKFRIRVDAWIFRNENGFVARALELPVVSEPANTQRGAVKQLKEQIKSYLDDLNATDELFDSISDNGFRGSIGSQELKVNFYSSARITLALPKAKPEPQP